jgi:V/A-type H+-transporting ATPase subunit C
MAQAMSGPAPYIYVCTRTRVRKAKLLPPEEYARMLNMSLHEITRFIEETEYKKEIDELGTSFSGIDLIETALSWNLAKEYQNILDITPGTLKVFIKAYLRHWDIQNILTLLRGKMQGLRPGKIKEVLIPAGSLDRVFLDRLLMEETPERVAETLKGTDLYPIVNREINRAVEAGTFSHMENELYKEFYAGLLGIARAGLKGGSQFLSFIQLDIDITNIRNLFRLRADQFIENIRSMMIPGGSFSVDELQQMYVIKDQNEFIETLQKRMTVKPVQEALEAMKGARSGHEIDVGLTRSQLEQMERMSKINPFSVHPILVYLERKRYEVVNLRAIARGKESNLSADRIRACLVI